MTVNLKIDRSQFDLQNTNVKHDLADFKKVAGKTGDVGYVRLDSKFGLKTVATSQKLSEKDAAMLKRLKSDDKGFENVLVRRSLFENVRKNLIRTRNDPQSTAMQRLAVLKFAAEKLGIQVQFDNGDIDSGIQFKGTSTRPLARRDIQSVLGVLDNKEFQTALQGGVPDKTQAFEHRQALIASMKKAYPDLGWKGLMLGRLSDANIDRLASIVLKGDVFDADNLRDIVESLTGDPPELDPTSGRISKTLEGYRRRESFIEEMKSSFPQFDWKHVPMERLSNSSLMKLAQHVLQGDFPDSNALNKTAQVFADQDFKASLEARETDRSHTQGSLERRTQLIESLKTHVEGIDWKQIPLGKLSNNSLRQLGLGILVGDIQTMVELKTAAENLSRDDVSMDKINDEDVLHRLVHAKDMDPELVTFSDPKQGDRVEEKNIYTKPNEPKFVSEQRDAELYDKAGNLKPRSEIHQILENRNQVPTGFSWNAIQTINTNPKMAKMVVSHFLEDFVMVSSKTGNELFSVLKEDKRALAVLVSCPKATFDAIFAGIPNAKLVKAQFEQLRMQTLTQVSETLKAKKNEGKQGSEQPQSEPSGNTFSRFMSKAGSLLKSATSKLVSNLIVEKTPEQLDQEGVTGPTLQGMLIEISKQVDSLALKKGAIEQSEESQDIAALCQSVAQQVKEILKTDTASRIDSEVRDTKKATEKMSALRGELSECLKNAHTQNESIEATVGKLVDVASRHIDALTMLLCHTDSVLEAFGNAQVLRPFVAALKNLINTEAKTALLAEKNPLARLEVNDVIDFAKPEFAGRIRLELEHKLAGWKENPASLNLSKLTGGIAGENTRLLLQVIGAAFDASASLPDRLNEATQAIGNVTEKEMRNALADLVLETETWISDEEQNSGERLLQMVQKNLDTFAVILCNPEKCARTLGLRAGIEEMIRSFKTQIGPIASTFTPGNEGLARVILQNMLSTMSVDQFAKIQRDINNAVQTGMEKIQALTGHAFESLLTGQDIGDLEEVLAAVDEENEQIALWKNEGKNDQEIEQLIKERREDHAFERSLRELTEAEALKKRHQRDSEKIYRQVLSGLTEQNNAEGIQALKQMRIQQLDTEFLTDLDEMTLQEGIEAWAKHRCYDKESRKTLLENFLRDHADDAKKTVGALRNGQKFDDMVAHYITEHNLRLKQFKNPILMTDHERSVLRIQESELADIAGKGALDTNTGYGKFMVEVMKNYFKDVSNIDKKSMLASLIRQGRHTEVPPDASPEQAAQIAKDDIARQLGALFKGAGPVMQKLLQQLGSTQVSKEFKLALEDMKMNLLPIPKEVVTAQLQGIIERYNSVEHLRNPEDPAHPLSPIVKINVDKSLGAASVGQTLLCTVQCADGTSRRVAVKLLRPDAQNRIDREKDIFLAVAKTIKGMEQTYLGRLERVLEEVDFTIEASNVKKGEVYDKALMLSDKKTYTDVKSMKLDKGIEVTRDTMVLECAPGKTVAALLSENDHKLEQIKSSTSRFPSSIAREPAVRELKQMIQVLEAKQAQLARLSYKWVEEGIFKSGFYHGDLHAGNIMVDTEMKDGIDKGLTVIDFGNATTLSEDDKGHIMRMVYGAQSNDASLFLENYRALLAPASLAHFDAVRAQAQELLTEIFKKGEDRDAGQRILGALTELQKLELELPAQIFNFSQCQILLQGTLDQVNTQLTTLHETLKQLHDLDDVGKNPRLFSPDYIPKCVMQCGKSDEDVAFLRNLVLERAGQYKDNAFREIELYLADSTKPHALAIREALGEPLERGKLDDPTVLQRLIDLIPERAGEALGNIKILLTATQSMLEIAEMGAGIKDVYELNRNAERNTADLEMAQKQKRELRLKVEDVSKLPDGVEISADALDLSDPALAKLLKSCATKQEMLTKLDTEMQTLRNKNPQTEDDKVNFPKYLEFFEKLQRAPDSFRPHEPFKKVEAAVKNVPALKILQQNSLGSIKNQLQRTLETLTLEKNSIDRKAPHCTKEKIDAINNINSSIKKLATKWEETITDYNAVPGMATLESAYAIIYPNESIPPNLTKTALVDLVSSLSAEMLKVKHRHQDLPNEIKSVREAIDEIVKNTKNWPETTPILPLPKFTDLEVREIGVLVRANIVNQLSPRIDALELQIRELSQRKVQSETNKMTNPVVAQIDRLCMSIWKAEGLFMQKRERIGDFDAPQTFFNVMQGVVMDHKLQSAMAVGVTTAIKAFFS